MLKYYFDLMSQPSRALWIFLKHTKIPFQECPVALRKGEQFGEKFAKINAFKRVPVIDHDGFILPESVAIFRYLSREFDVPDHWYPKDSKKQSLVDTYLEWQHLNIRLHGSLIFMVKVINPILTGESVNEKRLNRSREELLKSFTIMEETFLKDKPFLAGKEISVADILGACELEQPICSGENVLSEHKKVKAWFQNVKDKLQPVYDEAHDHIYRMKKKMAEVDN